MFAKAVARARQFTSPVITSSVTQGGRSQAGIGAFIHVNDEGWILTAAHIVQVYRDYDSSMKQMQKHEADVAAIHADSSLKDKEKGKRLRALGRPNPEWIRAFSLWWGKDGRQLRDVKVLPEGDLAIGRLDPFDPVDVLGYPDFKDPSKGVDSGTSLCRLGFPFHDVTPTFSNGVFQLPPETFPIPLFPNEGILTRLVLIGKHQRGYDVGFLETSNPGLRGQSGGPIFDREGTVWAVQSQTRHMRLGFSPPVPGGRSGEVEHQFMNVGWGTHPATVVGALAEHGIKHSLSPY